MLVAELRTTEKWCSAALRASPNVAGLVDVVCRRHFPIFHALCDIFALNN
jgi:hypothetical protein